MKITRPPYPNPSTLDELCVNAQDLLHLDAPPDQTLRQLAAAAYQLGVNAGMRKCTGDN